MSELQTAPIKNFALGIYDGPHATPKEVDEGPIFLGIKNVTPEGRLDLSEIRHVSEQEYPKWTKRVTPQKDDVVFSYEATLHRYALLPEGFHGCLGRRMALVRPDQSKIIPRFLHYYFMSPAWRAVVEANIINGATVDRIPIKKFPDFEVSIPSISKQRSISDALSAYDDLIENNRRRIQLLEQAARLLYKEWFVRLRFPGHEHVKIQDGVPEGWGKACLGDLCKLRAGDTFKPKYQGQQEGDLPFIKVRDLSREGNTIAVTGSDNWIRLDECEEFRGKPFSRGTSVFAKIGEGLRQNRVRFIVRDTLIDNNLMGAIPDPRITVSEFLYFLLEGHDLASYAGGAAVPFLSSKVLEGVGVLVPSMQLLLLFQDAVAPMFQQVVTLELQSTASAKARDLLLPKLMNGEVAV